MGGTGAGSPLFLCPQGLNFVILPKGVAESMIGLRKIDGGALAEEVRSMGRPARGAKPGARPLKEEAAKGEGARRARFGGRRLREGLKVVSGFDSYVPWAGADATYAKIAAAGKLGELEDWLEEIYPNGIDETALNDLLWFDRDEVLSAMGLSDDDDDGEGIGESAGPRKDAGKPLPTPQGAEHAVDKAPEGVSEGVLAGISEGVSEGAAEMDFAVSGNGFEPSSEDDDVGSFVGF